MVRLIALLLRTFWVRSSSFMILFVGVFFRLVACDCPETTIEQNFQKADLIFIGKATEVNTNWMSGGMKITFVSSQTWKEKRQNLQVILTPFEQGCGVEFEVGKEYLVYAEKLHISYKTTKCSGTKLLDLAEGDLTFLGKAQDKAHDQSFFRVVFMLVWVVISSLFLLYVLFRKRKIRKT